MTESSTVRCSRCGHVLTDPISKALRIGPECRGGSKKPSKRQVSYKAKVSRGTAFTTLQPLSVGNMTYTHTQAGWTNNLNERTITDSRLREWLEFYKLAIFPEEHKTTVLKQREKLVAALNIDPAEYKMSGKERQELIAAIGEIDMQIHKNQSFRSLAIGHGSKPWSVDNGRRKRAG